MSTNIFPEYISDDFDVSEINTHPIYKKPKSVFLFNHFQDDLMILNRLFYNKEELKNQKNKLGEKETEKEHEIKVLQNIFTVS